MSRKAFTKKREYIRCSTACSAAGVQVDRHPVRHGLRVPGPRVVVRRAVAQEIPGRVDEGVHGVGLAARFGAAHRAAGLQEVGVRLQRVTPVGAKSTSSGSRTGSWSSGTGWAPCSGQYTIGIVRPSSADG